LQRTSETALLNDKFSRTVFCWSDPFSRHRTMGIRFPCGRSPVGYTRSKRGFAPGTSEGGIGG